MKNRICPGAICKSNPHYSVSVTVELKLVPGVQVVLALGTYFVIKPNRKR